MTNNDDLPNSIVLTFNRKSFAKLVADKHFEGKPLKEFIVNVKLGNRIIRMLVEPEDILSKLNANDEFDGVFMYSSRGGSLFLY
jgi:hypothetical protein